MPALFFAPILPVSFLIPPGFLRFPLVPQNRNAYKTSRDADAHGLARVKGPVLQSHAAALRAFEHSRGALANRTVFCCFLNHDRHACELSDLVLPSCTERICRLKSASAESVTASFFLSRSWRKQLRSVPESRRVLSQQGVERSIECRPWDMEYEDSSSYSSSQATFRMGSNLGSIAFISLFSFSTVGRLFPCS
jgi:hypothetical protein